MAPPSTPARKTRSITINSQRRLSIVTPSPCDLFGLSSWRKGRIRWRRGAGDGEGAADLGVPRAHRAAVDEGHGVAHLAIVAGAAEDPEVLHVRLEHPGTVDAPGRHVPVHVLTGGGPLAVFRRPPGFVGPAVLGRLHQGEAVRVPRQVRADAVAA